MLEIDAHALVVIPTDRARSEEVVDAGPGFRVEVAADDGRDLARVGVDGRLVVARTEIALGRQLAEPDGDALELVHEHGDLDELDVLELGVPVDVGVGDDETHAGLAMLEQGDDRDLILGHDPVEHVLRLAEVGPAHRDLVELDELRLDHAEDGALVEGRAAVDVPPLVRAHRARPRLGVEDALVLVLGQLRAKVLFVRLDVDFLVGSA